MSVSEQEINEIAAGIREVFRQHRAELEQLAAAQGVTPNEIAARLIREAVDIYKPLNG